MARKLTIVLLVIGLCLMGLTPVWTQKVYSTLAEYEKLTGGKIEKFSEAPSLKVKVASGKLPPVEERLPDEPLVVKPLDEIGRYGGILRAATSGPTWGGADDTTTREEMMFRLSPELTTIVPNIAKDWDLSEDYKTLTIYLRKGMRWSDGAPFTADDMMFWYEDIILNDELTPIKPKRWSPGGELVKVEKMDDYAVRFQFAVSYPPIITLLASTEEPFRPKHFLKQYHIKYNSRAGEIAKKEGYDEWWMCFNFHNLWNWGQRQQDINLPSICPWALKKIASNGDKYFERNPYYWKVDIAGNQLPYIDEQVKVICENKEIINLKTIAGEFTHAGFFLTLKNYPLYKKGERKGNYHVMLWKEPIGTKLAYYFNLTHKDPVLRKIFNDVRFLQAMSLAINREEINEIFFFGKGIPRQATTPPTTSFYEDWMGEYYAEYDPERADKLLDEMGLRWDKNHKYRLRPDGKTLSITIEWNPTTVPAGKISELVKDHWEKIGVKVALKEEQRTFFVIRGQANEGDLRCWLLGSSTEFAMRNNNCNRFYPGGTYLSCYPWGTWYRSSGKTGEEPPEIVKRLYNVIDEWRTTVPETEEYMKLGKEILTINLKIFHQIGTVGLLPKPVIVKNNLYNTPKEGMFINDYRYWRPYQGDQWFFKK